MDTRLPDPSPALDGLDPAALVFGVLEGLPIGVALFDQELRFAQVNPEMARINGLPAAAHLGRTMSEIARERGLPLAPAERWEAAVRGVFASGEGVYGLEVSGSPVEASQTTRYTRASWYPLRQDGTVRMVAAVVEDVTEHRRAEERGAALAAISESLSRAQTLAEVRRVLMNEGVVALGADGGRLRLLTSQGLEEADQPFTWISLETDHPAAEAARSGAAVFDHGGDAHLPLGRGAQTFGVFSLHFAEPKDWDETERSFALALADRTAAAYERARLFEEETRARSAAERALGRMTALQEVTAALVGASDPLGVMAGVVEKATEALTALQGSLYLLSPTGDSLECVLSYSTDRDIRPGRERIPLTAQIPVAEVACDGQPRFLGSLEEVEECYPHLVSTLADTGFGAAAVLPLRGPQGVAGVLSLVFAQPRGFPQEDQQLLQTLADVAALALERSRLFEELERQLDENRTLLEILPVGVWVGNADLSEIRGNAAAYRLLGLPEGSNAAVAHPQLQTPPGLRIFVEGAEVSPEDAPMQRVARSGKATQGLEHTLVLPDGGAATVIANIAPILDEERRVRGVIGAYTDITERKAVEERLRASEERLRLATQANRLVAWEWEVERNRITVTENFAEIYGLPPLSGVEQGFALVWPEDLPAHRAKVEQVVREGGEYRSELRITRPADGRTVWLEEHAVALTDPQGRVTRLVGITQDITERKRGELALKESEHRLQAVLEALPVGVIVTEPDGRLIQANPQIERIWQHGVTAAEDLSSYPQHTGYHPDGRPLEPEEWPLARTLRSGERVEGEEIRFRRGDGSLGTMLVSSAPIRDAGGALVAGAAAFSDISALKETEARLRLALEAGRMGVWEWDLESDTQFWSPEQERLFGLEPGQGRYTGGAFFGLVHPDDRERLRSHSFAGGQEYVEDEFRLVRPDGETVWLSVRARLHRNAAGRVVRMTGINTDITERKEVELALRESEERFRLATSTGAVGVWDWDITADRVAWSDSIYQIHGLEPKSFGGTVAAFAALVHPDDRPKVEEALRRALEEGSPYELEFRAVRPDGSTVWIYTQARVLRDSTGAPRRMLGAVVDITARKRMEEGLRFLSEASQALAASLDPEETLRALARQAVPTLGDWCGVYLPKADGTLEPLVVHHADLGKVELVKRMLRRFPIRQDAEMGTGGAYRSGKARLIPVITDALLEAAGLDPEYLEMLKALELRSGMNLPMVARGQVLGVIDVVSSDPHRRYDENDLALGEELARRAASALENARLYQQTRLSEARHRRLFDSGMLGVFYWRENGAILEANERFLEMVGYTQGDLEGGRLDWRALTPPEYTALDQHALQELSTQGVMNPIEKEYLRKDGSRVPILLGGARLAEGEMQGVAFVLDLTERKRAEARLEALQQITARLGSALTVEEAYRAVLQERLGDLEAERPSVALVQGDEMHMTFTSDADPALVRRWSQFPLAAALPASEVARSGEPLFLSPESLRNRYSTLNLPPESLEHATAILPLRLGRQVLGTLNLGFARDHTFDQDEQEFLQAVADQLAQALRRTRLYEELHQSEQRYRALSEAQKRFVNDAAHELRAPLTAIQGNLELLTRFKGMKKADREETLQEVAKEAARLGRLVNDMLALARGDAGERLRLEPLSLHQVLREAFAIAQGMTNEHTLHLIPLPNVEVRGDRDRLKQLALQLLENALKYTPAGGTVTLGLRRDSDHAEFWVEDTGIGIAPEELPRVFERFYRSDKARLRGEDPGGTGLGLSIAQWIVKQHGGTLHLESQLGRGTVAVVRLPLTPSRD